jgi:long-subunit acyl-CoA synthetase (AMP-forming)
MSRFLPVSPGNARPALTDGVRHISYGELPGLLQAEQRWLADSGARRIALLADNGCAWALTDLALAGLAATSPGLLNVPLPGYFTPRQMAHVLADASVDAVLTDQPATLSGLHHGFAHAGVSARTGLSLWQRAAPADVRPVPAGTAKITYTSGSTAEPKGVCLSAAHLESVARALASATADLNLSRHLCLLPLATLLENLGGIYAVLLSGATCDLPSLAETGMSYGALQPGRLTSAIAAREPDSLILVPELLRVLVKATVLGWPPPASLRFIAVGGAHVSPALLAHAERAGLPVYEGYGLSECGSVVALNTPAHNRPGSVGRPLPHVQVRLDDRQQIIVRNSAMLGYLGDVSLAADGEIETGDLGRFDADGFLYVHGRLKNLLITGLGRNIAPEWVERELQQEPEIAAAIVAGEARPYLTALISPSTSGTGHSLIDAAVARANSRLPDYARVRRWALAAEPFTFTNGSLTANGRLRRGHILREHAQTLDWLYREPATTLEIRA